MKEKTGKETRNVKNEGLEVEEVNVYASGCGVIKTHCMYDCFGTNDAWLSTEQ
ncbi:hypothetical protein [Lachnotalea glycerini]|uniref:hypothetical protein n=1 Tax=Lachnotalea glycerini TaxID=1763509 RepID=UPI0015F29DDB|nr:hypothetical protein [Lachnotalea glycerini]